MLHCKIIIHEIIASNYVICMLYGTLFCEERRPVFVAKHMCIEHKLEPYSERSIKGVNNIETMIRQRIKDLMMYIEILE